MDRCTHCRDGDDFKPAQDPRELVGCDIGSPFDPHILLDGMKLQKWTQQKQKKKVIGKNYSQRNGWTEETT